MSNNRLITVVCGVVAAAGLTGAGAALAQAATPDSTTTATSSPTSTSAPDRGGYPFSSHGPSRDTAVTGTELTKVRAAVTSKVSSVTVSSVRQDPDGSYDVFGTKAGAPVMLEVSKDLKTVSTGPQRPESPRQDDEGASTTL